MSYFLSLTVSLTVFFTVFFTASFTLAQTVNLNDLKGQELCLEPRSVQVSITEQGAQSNAEMVAVVKEKLETSLEATLTGFSVPFQRKESCDDEDGFVYVLYTTSLGQDNSANPFLFYGALVQVGQTMPELKADFSTSLPNKIFNQFLNTVFFEDELTEATYLGIAERNEEMIRNLGLAWWDSYMLVEDERRTQQEQWLRIGLVVSAVLSLLVLLLAVLFVVKKRKKI